MTHERQRLGAAGEQAAVNWYTERGYEILDRNWRCREGELDIVCRAGAVLVFSEVKTRSSLAYGHPAEAVTPAKQRQVLRVARRWLTERDGSWRPGEIRFDVAAVLSGEVEVLEGAF